MIPSETLKSTYYFGVNAMNHSILLIKLQLLVTATVIPSVVPSLSEKTVWGIVGSVNIWSSCNAMSLLIKIIITTIIIDYLYSTCQELQLKVPYNNGLTCKCDIYVYMFVLLDEVKVINTKNAAHLSALLVFIFSCRGESSPFSAKFWEQLSCQR